MCLVILTIAKINKMSKIGCNVSKHVNTILLKYGGGSIIFCLPLETLHACCKIDGSMGKEPYVGIVKQSSQPHSDFYQQNEKDMRTCRSSKGVISYL